MLLGLLYFLEDMFVRECYRREEAGREVTLSRAPGGVREW